MDATERQEKQQADEQAVATAKRVRGASEQPNRLGTERIGKLILEFAIPAITATLLTAFYNVIDTAFLGIAFPDGTGVAVTTLALPVMNALTGFSMIAGIGGNAMAALQLGAGDKDKVERTMGNSTDLLFILAFALGLMSVVFIDPLLTVIGTPPELWEQTKTFVQIICVFGFFQSVGYGVQNYIRTAGKPRFSLLTSVMGTASCIFFNWLFVLELGLGVAGSAMATVFGQAFMFVPVMWFFTLNKKAPFHLRLRCMRPDLRLMGRILVMGLAMFAMQMAATVVTVVFNQVVGVHAVNDPIGVTGALAAMGVAQKAGYFAFCPIIGIIMAAQPIIGFNYGARNWSRVLKTFKWVCIDAAAVGTFFFFLCHIIPGPIVSVFSVSDELKDFSIWTLQLYTLWFGFVGYQAAASNYFQASGQPIKSTILELSRQVIFLIPFYLLLPEVMAGLLGVTALQAIAICSPLSDAAATILTTFFVVREVRKLRRLRAQEEQCDRIEQCDKQERLEKTDEKECDHAH